jgi:ABC-type nickel/cobalt efflux system permease component RcnA
MAPQLAATPANRAPTAHTRHAPRKNAVFRTLITAALLTAAATQLLGFSPDIALAYALVLTTTLWYLWPLLRLAARTLRRPHRHPATPAPRTPHLTQINHHHHYGQLPASQPQPNHTFLALPQRSEQQIAHDAIYNTIDEQP